MRIGEVASVESLNVRRTRRGGGGGRKSEFLDKIRTLQPGQGITITPDDNEEFDNLAMRVNGVYRKVDGKFAVGFRPSVHKDYANQRIVISRPNVVESVN